MIGSVALCLPRIARRLPDTTALVCGTRRVPYAALRRRIQRLAAHLVDDGVRPGDRVVLLLEADIEYAVAVHAVLVAGAVIVAWLILCWTGLISAELLEL